jgi:translation initiation factor IF-2
MSATSHTKEESVIRPPVIAIMGHIDHGKSTLLDYIRKSNVVAKEAGGITQHIGAYEVEYDQDGTKKKITFLDTPGHEAFCAVRERGAKIADIAVLIVSAEDGVKPQTKEALDCIKNAGLPYVVAINKIDSPKANIDLCKASLMENEIYLEGLGGTISYAEISAKTGQGVTNLFDIILLTAEIENYSCNPHTLGSGYIVEAQKDKFKGITGTLILKNGIASKGDFVVTANAYSPIRTILDQNQKQHDSVTCSPPFTVSGFDTLPIGGDTFEIVKSKKEAEDYILEHKSLNAQADRKDVSCDEHSIFLPIIIKSDVIGSKDAIEYELRKININHVILKVIRSETGDITEADTQLALTNPRTIIIGFNTKTDPQARTLIERNNIKVKNFNIIYEIQKWVEEIALEEQPTHQREEVIAEVKILKVFGNAKKLQIIGGRVQTGTVEKGLRFKIMRRGEEVGPGTLKGLQRNKQEVDSVPAPEEFGCAVDTKFDLAEGDILNIVKMVKF